ncbi:hypothetical protein COV93_08440 [Candidatus Woesearchaeota archaeon CG11_big_fil_rev_8_21_14_0_20_43_8]|nr:MAG: hypothetical protein COV93_08440 [Candidatus Woesearchaeota archaeon CG11_big_fil_rev_8_21_14_0_20_43_8]PIO05172.1 MAG: hypothetical protein COT47_05880 [Candidatus Woesearchaeota archaeon CG08_land_8_20_14_0_20_43_7]
MIDDFRQINTLFSELDSASDRKIRLYLLGGAVLLFHGLKPATKDIDIVVQSKREFNIFKNRLIECGFQPKIPDKGYTHLNLSQIFVRDDFRIDLFEKTVCKKAALSKNMIRRAKKVSGLKNLEVFLCSREDIFFFKTMTEREGDLDDCMSLAKEGLEWKDILDEVVHQAQSSGNDVWVTWVGEKMDILQQRGLVIPIMDKIHDIVKQYYAMIERKFDTAKDN